MSDESSHESSYEKTIHDIVGDEIKFGGISYTIGRNGFYEADYFDSKYNITISANGVHVLTCKDPSVLYYLLRSDKNGGYFGDNSSITFADERVHAYTVTKLSKVSCVHECSRCDWLSMVDSFMNIWESK